MSPEQTSSAATSPTGARGWRIAAADRPAIWWAIACCWLAVAGTYALLAFGLKAEYIVPFDLFAVPLLVTLAFRLFRRRPRSSP